MRLPDRTFYFLRHGETHFNREGRFQGRLDVPLNELGISQARNAARILATESLSRIVCSPANRVIQTASIVAESSGIPLDVEPDLMEFFVGSFEGKRVDTLRRDHGIGPHDSILTILPDDADDWEQFVVTVTAAVTRRLDQHAGESVLIAAHGLVFRALTQALTGTQHVSQNAAPFLCKKDRNSWQILPVEGRNQGTS
jgi:broad specificity phosphatase PhoE